MSSGKGSDQGRAKPLGPTGVSGVSGSLSGRPSKSFSRGKKHQVSINHLVDFQYENRPVQTHKSRKPPQKRRYSAPKIILSGMSFINVNYKFVVDYRNDYRVQRLDPNVPVDPEDILTIVAPRGQACPICLEDVPVAPRMLTACGHVLCLTCLLLLLDSEIPQFKKHGGVVEKYRDCPLCASVIRPKDVKPVVLEDVDERFETPKIFQDAVLSLVSRPHDSILALPVNLDHLRESIGEFPWVGSEPDVSSYLRIFKGDLAYILKYYHNEKQSLTEIYNQERELYNDDGVLYRKAMANIDKDIDSWAHKFDGVVKESRRNNSEKNQFFFYQTGFKASATYVLSPLDMRVLKSAYGDYANLPTSIVVKVENIKFEELNEESSTKKHKYLAHLPLGTTIGFLECDWLKNEVLDENTWTAFKEELTKRSKASKRKFHREEKSRKLALDKEEVRTRNFYERENNPTYRDDESFGFSNITLSDYTELPLLKAEHSDDKSEKSEEEYETSIWGTKIRKAEKKFEEDEDDWDAEEMIRRAKEEMNKQDGKKKKKRLVLLSSQ